ncbi:hypothetical protein GCM10011504_49340 [Siccirubricoccus deserti]|nr:hypothetical protein GCM10011504_49340 [Siccirubricoccus deserti]
MLCVVDDFTREALATVVDASISGTRVVRELERWWPGGACLRWSSATTAQS